MPRTLSLSKYSQLSLDEDEGKSQHQSPSRIDSAIRNTAFGIFLSILGFTIILLLLLSLSILMALILPRILPTQNPSCAALPQGDSGAIRSPAGYKAGTAQPCGNSPAEAEAAGCVFDLMTVSWLPLDCYDGELTAQFMEEGPWTFYLSNSTRPEALPEERVQIATLEEISKTTELMWTDRRFHIYHCIYGWKMMHRAIERGWKMESSLSTYHHTEHCSDTLANTTVPMDAVITRVDISYPAC